MKKLIISAICLLAFAAGVSSYAYYHSHQIVAKNSLAQANVEAITENGTLDCSYNRDESSCEIYVGVGGQVKVFNKGVISAGADGMVVFPGKVVCSSGGSYTCRPVECVDIYEVIFN